MGKGNINIDFIEPFGYIFYGSPCEIAPLGLLLRRISQGKFFKGVHQTPHDPGANGNLHPGYLISFCLKSLLNGYTL